MTDAAVLPPGVIRIDSSGRRQYSVEYKRRLAQLTLEPGASVAGIALRHRLNANQLFKWRRWYLLQRGSTVAATLLPVVVAPSQPTCRARFNFINRMRPSALTAAGDSRCWVRTSPRGWSTCRLTSG